MRKDDVRLHAVQSVAELYEDVRTYIACIIMTKYFNVFIHTWLWMLHSVLAYSDKAMCVCDWIVS